MSLIEVSAPPTWSELRQTVRDVRSHFSNRGLRTPSCLTFRKTGGRTRLYFLSEPASKRDTSLLYVDLPPTVGQAHNPQWCPLIEAGFQVIPGPVRYIILPHQQALSGFRMGMPIYLHIVSHHTIPDLPVCPRSLARCNNMLYILVRRSSCYGKGKNALPGELPATTWTPPLVASSSLLVGLSSSAQTLPPATQGPSFPMKFK